eukprot:358448-Chlamydomonas_euryale.AAC.6
MQGRRESRIPRPAAPLGDRSNTAPAAFDRKRKAGGADAAPEASKRSGGTDGGGAFNAAATRGDPAPVAGGAAATGPAAADEAWECIAERTGQTETGLLSKKMSMKKTMRADKKVEELVPMVKELRCAPFDSCGCRDGGGGRRGLGGGTKPHPVRQG